MRMTEPTRKIVIIDDELGANGSVHQRAFLRRYGKLPLELHFEECADESRVVEAALAAVQTVQGASLVLLDLKFGRLGTEAGYEILRALRRTYPAIPVLIMSSMQRDVNSLASCLEYGATGFVGKELSADELHKAIERAIAMAQAHSILGGSSRLRALRRQAARLSPYDRIPVLIVGARGTGKERVARYIHHNGPRAERPFVPVNCAGIPESLMEAELFGAEKGAYTGAESRRMGYIERAQGGVLFLDEVGEMTPATQAKLLRVLQDGLYRRVGVTKDELQADFQLICATNVEPELLIERGNMREDFYDRIAAVTINTPSLDDCREDIEILLKHFVRQMGLAEEKEFSREAIRALECASWPGNVRQLQRTVQEAVVVSEDSSVVDVTHLPAGIARARDPAPNQARDGVATAMRDWAADRLLGELEIAVAVKRDVQRRKGRYWKAEFMRMLYPECKAANAKGFQDLVRRLSNGPWGCSQWRKNERMAVLLGELTD